MNKLILNRIGKKGKHGTIQYPFNIIGEKNIFIDDGVNIGAGSTIFTKNAKIIIGKNTFSGPNLTMISGDHPYLPGSYMKDLRKKELRKMMDVTKFDKDIIIDQDVWIGANVLKLKGVHVGRCSICAAGSLINKDVPPYSIVAGVPARFIKFKWNIKQIIEHEKFLFINEKDRMTHNEIIELFKTYKSAL